MYNKQSCRECGAYLIPHSFCMGCREHVSWECGQCGKIDDYTHVHNYCRTVFKREIVVETVRG
jgi:hypothetical protein